MPLSPEPMHVVLCCDENYYLQIVVVMTSVMENNDSGRSVHFHILESGFTDEQKECVERIKEQYDCDVEFIDVEPYLYLFEKTDVSEFRNKYVSLACYYRLLIFHLITDVESCIYMDGDMITDVDLGHLLDTYGDSLMAAVPESFAMERKDTVLSHLKTCKDFDRFNEDPNNYPYCNAGLLVMNLSKSEELNIWDELIGFYDENPNMPYADQDIINAIFFQRHHDLTRFMPARYNVFCDSTIDHSYNHSVAYFSQQEMMDAYGNPSVYHYAGVQKPWCNPISNYYEKWWDYALKSHVKEELVSNLLVLFRESKENQRITIIDRMRKCLLKTKNRLE